MSFIEILGDIGIDKIIDFKAIVEKIIDKLKELKEEGFSKCEDFLFKLKNFLKQILIFLVNKQRLYLLSAISSVSALISIIVSSTGIPFFIIPILQVVLTFFYRILI